MNLEGQLNGLEEKRNAAEKRCDALLSIAFGFFSLAEQERNIGLKYRFYMWRGARIQHKAIGYHIKFSGYINQ